MFYGLSFFPFNPTGNFSATREDFSEGVFPLKLRGDFFLGYLFLGDNFRRDFFLGYFYRLPLVEALVETMELDKLNLLKRVGKISRLAKIWRMAKIVLTGENVWTENNLLIETIFFD